MGEIRPTGRRFVLFVIADLFQNFGAIDRVFMFVFLCSSSRASLLKKDHFFAVCGMEIDMIVMHVIICSYGDVQLNFYRYFDLYFL